jgi:hypothetical protein
VCSLPELVHDGVNGRIFGANSSIDPAVELSAQFAELFSDFSATDSDAKTQLSTLRAGAIAWSRVAWQECWQASCGPLLTKKELACVKAEKATAKRSALMKMLAFVLILVGALMMLM